MELKGTSKLMRIFIGELDKIGGNLLYKEIVKAARQSGIAGATVTRGVLSYGSSSVEHKMNILALSADLPLIIEIVDDGSKIDEFIPVVNQLFEKADCGGLITMENVEIIKHQTVNKVKQKVN